MRITHRAANEIAFGVAGSSKKITILIQKIADNGSEKLDGEINACFILGE